MPPVSREGIQFLALRGSSLPQSTSGIRGLMNSLHTSFSMISFHRKLVTGSMISFHRKLVTGLMISFHKKLVTGLMISFHRKLVTGLMR